LAAGALIALGPLLLVSMVVLKLDSPGPVLFKQNRRGFNGRSFRILKLRTMHVLEDGPTIIQTTKHDRRVTRFGRWLRRTSVDELPQLWNVIRGDMSIVGPRPHAIAHDEFYDELIENYAYRQHVKPGLTGWAQVHGFRGETPRVDDMKMRVEHDLWYVSNWSFGLDLRIVLLTCTRILGEGAY
jgi:lipopolysaccharide/colanic/teichoic acid biosynthesis glycosyltransferase